MFQYLQGTRNLKITYSGANPTGIFGYLNSDYAGDTSDRKSTHEYVFTLAGGAISWSSWKQKTTSTSTTEAGYVRLCSAAKTAAWITEWLRGANLTQFLNHKPVQLYGDNQLSIHLVKNPEFHTQTKHVDVQYTM